VARTRIDLPRAPPMNERGPFRRKATTSQRHTPRSKPRRHRAVSANYMRSRKHVGIGAKGLLLIRVATETQPPSALRVPNTRAHTAMEEARAMSTAIPALPASASGSDHGSAASVHGDFRPRQIVVSREVR